MLNILFKLTIFFVRIYDYFWPLSFNNQGLIFLRLYLFHFKINATEQSGGIFNDTIDFFTVDLAINVTIHHYKNIYCV